MILCHVFMYSSQISLTFPIPDNILIDEVIFHRPPDSCGKILERGIIMTAKKPVKITETILRDAHQSLCATRMRIEQMIPQLDALDAVGYNALEAWGGATFDSCLRFLNEDPWERLDTLRAHLKKTPIQMLLRGQNLLGYNHYNDDVVRAFVRKASEHGVKVFRIF